MICQVETKQGRKERVLEPVVVVVVAVDKAPAPPGRAAQAAKAGAPVRAVETEAGVEGQRATLVKCNNPVNRWRYMHMAGFDRTGPMGNGPMTGGMRGSCNPSASGFGAMPGYGRGFGFGAGRGARRGYGRYLVQRSPVNPGDELDALRHQAEVIRRNLEAIQGRIADLEKNAS